MIYLIFLLKIVLKAHFELIFTTFVVNWQCCPSLYV